MMTPPVYKLGESYLCTDCAEYWGMTTVFRAVSTVPPGAVCEECKRKLDGDRAED